MSRKKCVGSVVAVSMLTALAAGEALGQCELQKLLPSDGAAGDSYGDHVAINGGRAIVCACFHDHGDLINCGSAYAYRWNGTEWGGEQELVTSDASHWDYYGWAVAMSGEVAIVTSVWDDDRGFNSGSAYVFRWNGAQWIESGKLLASDGAVNDEFGYSAAMSGDVALVGAWGDDDLGLNSGSAYVFRYDRDAGTWTEEQKLIASDGAAEDYFGVWLGMNGPDMAIVGAHHDDNENGVNAGAAYVFQYDVDAGTWTETQKLIAGDGVADDRLAWPLAVGDDVAVLGAYRADNENGIEAGSAYVFRFDRDAGTWAEEQKLIASDGADEDHFGNWMTTTSSRLIVGAAHDDNEHGADAGSAYVFRFEEGTWVEKRKLTASDGTAGAWFGATLALDGDLALVTAALDDDNGDDSGSAYAYDLFSCLCLSDLDGSGAVDFGDILRILSAWGPCEGDCPEDLDDSGAVDFGDILSVLTAWGPCE